MNRILERLVVFAVASIVFSPTLAKAQTEINARGATVTIGGRLHVQARTSTVDGAVALDSYVRRARIFVGIEVNDFFEARILPDFAGGQTTLLDAYVTLKFDPIFALSMGQLKRASDIFMSSSSTQLSIIERDGEVPGASGCPGGVGGACSFGSVTTDLLYSGRDMGMRIEGMRGRFSYMGTITNGTGINVPDENASKSFAGRANFAVKKGLVVSGFVGVHDYLSVAGETGHAEIYGADLEIGEWTEGVHIQAAIATGENWRVLDPMGEPVSFLTSQVVITYYFPLSSERWAGVEPLARVSRTDHDTGSAGNGAWLITPGLSLYVSGRNKIGSNLDIYRSEAGVTELSLKVQAFVYF